MGGRDGSRRRAHRRALYDRQRVGHARRRVEGGPRLAARRSGAFWTTLKLSGLYAIYASVSVGIVMTLLRGPQSTLVAVAAATFIMAWIAYGGIWLARAVPREDPLPRGLGERVSRMDEAFLAVIIVSLAYLLLAA